MMTNKQSILILIVCALSFFSCSQFERDELKVLSWNIWHGNHVKKYPVKGCEGTIGILKHSNADVILLIETYGSAHNVADALGYYHRSLSSNLSIYSRYPIVETYTFPDKIGAHNLGGVMIDKDGKKFRIFDTWLHYLPDARLVPTDKSEAEIIAWDDEGTRDDEIKRIMSVLKPFMSESDSIPIIMGGDFNGHSHLDWTEATKDMYNHGGAVVNWTVSKVMQQNGFKDSFREMHPDPAKSEKELGPTWYWLEGGKVKGRMDRIDYIYYQGKNIKVKASESYNCGKAEMLDFYGKKFFYASDHGFVMTTFSIGSR